MSVISICITAMDDKQASDVCCRRLVDQLIAQDQLSVSEAGDRVFVVGVHQGNIPNLALGGGFDPFEEYDDDEDETDLDENLITGTGEDSGKS